MEKQDFWSGFKGTDWQEKIDVRSFIMQNYAAYEGDGTFLAAPTTRTKRLYDKMTEKFREETEK